MRYTKLPTIVQYKVGFGKSKPSEEKYPALISIGISIVLLSISLARSKISISYFYWERR
jgi:multidrug transporter EmrE-like cation transporter